MTYAPRMTSHSDGRHTCDGCGRDVGGGGVNTTVVVSAVRVDPHGVPAPAVLHLCLREWQANSDSIIGGCGERALNAACGALVAASGPLDLYDPVEADPEYRARREASQA